jgi:YVTN family beta-propeller protein
MNSAASDVPVRERNCGAYNAGSMKRTRGLLRGAAALLFLFALSSGSLRLGAADQKGLQKAYITILGTKDGGWDNQISVIDLKTMKITGNIMVGVKPHGAAAQADGRRVFTTIETEKALKIIDTATDKITDTIPLTGTPNELAVTPNGKFIAVPIHDNNSIDIVDVAQKKVVKVLPDKVPHNCYNAGSNRHMYCTSVDDHLVYQIDLETMSLTGIPVGGEPRSVAVSKDEKTVFVTFADFRGFAMTDIASKTIQRVEFPRATSELPPDSGAHGMEVTPNGKELWTNGVNDNAVYVYNLASKQFSKKIAVGKSPRWLSFSPEGKYAFVSVADSDQCVIIDTATYQEVARLKVGRFPMRSAVAYSAGF